MHLPDGLLDPVTIVVLWIVTISFLIIGYFKVKRQFKNTDSDRLIPYIGVLAAVIFAFQFVNYPIPGGTSGHLVGGTLVAVILGPWASLIIITLVLVVQSLFGDGGITVLGANAFNMGIIAGMVGFYIVVLFVRLFNHTSLKKEIKVMLSTAIGAYIAIVLAAFLCGVEISLNGIISFQVAVTAMVFWHLFIGIGEAVISALIIYYIYKVKPDFITTEAIMGV
jgi:cobalt/nickel transport system permease protein